MRVAVASYRTGQLPTSVTPLRLGGAPRVSGLFTMTEKEWRAELDTALSAGLPWRVSSAWCHRGAPTCGAELTHTSSGRVKGISLPLSEFPNAAVRKAEIVRLLTMTTTR